MKRFLKFRFILPTAIVLLTLVIFGGWYVLPSHPLSIVVLDKTVSASGGDTADTIADYRKHYGLFWMLNQLKINNAANNLPYDHTTDYYGSLMSDSGKSMARLDKTPDLVYIADAYGVESDAQSSEKTDAKGISYEDIASASIAHKNGATLIAEADSLAGATEESIQKEIEALFGMSYSSWKGRYITEMSDLSDVPSWAQSLYQSQYGRQWDYAGAGILLISDQSELIVLEQAADFNGSMLTVSITDTYQKEFGRHSLNYYNWFEIVEAAYNTETIAEYRLDLSDAGKAKFSKVSDKLTFPAVMRTKGEASPTYYFAGDFNDYVASGRFSRFLFSNSLYQFFSYDRPGDITNFYWNFYYPLMKTILHQTEQNKGNVRQPAINTAGAFRIQNNRFETLDGDAWKPFVIKGFNLNAVMPGHQPIDYTRDIAVYRQFVSEIADMGGNCIRVYDLMPPEFYRALYEHNLANADKRVYFMQSIVSPDTVSDADALADAPLSEWKKSIEYAIGAIHGQITVPPVGSRAGGTYIQDVSAYLMGYLVEVDSQPQTIQKLNSLHNGYTYTGDYMSSTGNAAEGLVALLCDYTYTYQQKTYGYLSPVGAVGNAALASRVSWTHDTSIAFDVDALTASDKTEDSYFVSYALQPHDTILLNNTAQFAAYTDTSGSFPYGGYIHDFKQTQNRYPVLVDRFGLSTNTNAFEKESSINGLSETAQGEGIVRMLRAIEQEGYLGGLISDYNDNWSLCADALAPYILPLKDNPLWQNALDPQQNSGVTAMDPTTSGTIGMSVKDNDRMKEMQISTDAAYVYMTIMLDSEVNYDKEQLIIGLDTYQRNNGEYLYDPAYFATSLSGMEYVIKFESKNTAAIYVVPSYNRENGQYSSKESYTGAYNYIAQLSYGTFETSNSNFYQAGSTIHVRIPWNLLNFTDPAKKMVINDTRTPAEIANDVFGIQTTSTDGMLFSLLIADKETKDSLYIFPTDKQSSGYKTFKWDTWTTVDYVLRQKQSIKIISRYFNTM